MQELCGSTSALTQSLGAIDDDKLKTTISHKNALHYEPINASIEEKKTLALTLNECEQALLHHIFEHSYSGVVERYRRLDVSRKNGDTSKKSFSDSRQKGYRKLTTPDARHRYLSPAMSEHHCSNRSEPNQLLMAIAVDGAHSPPVSELS